MKTGVRLRPALKTPKALGFQMPAEWEPHDAIWMSWPHDPLTFGEGLPQVELAYVRWIKEIHRTERVNLFVLDDLAKKRILGLFEKARVDIDRIRFFVHDYADVWFRDYGPSFVVNRTKKQLGMVHWIFNAWGGKYEELKKDTNIPLLIEKDLAIPAFRPGVVMEGGAIDVNGAGTVLTTEQCLLNKNRNPSLSRGRIEDVLRENLGVEQVLWLKEGVAGDDTDGHIDDIARFASPDTVLCAIEGDRSDENYRPLKENAALLAKAKNAQGRPIKVEELPMPEPVTDSQGRLPASYANFYIGNGVVLVPVFQCRQDNEALRVIERAFPGRRVAPIPAREFVRGLGTLHCASQQQPSVG